MTEQLTLPGAPEGPARPDPAPGSNDVRSLPRALRPFRHPAYRKLALALAFSTFASGVWVVAMVWEVIRIGGGPASSPVAAVPHPAYRKLALALAFSTFASGVWVVAIVWEVIRIGGGPAQLSVVSTAGAVGVLLPALLGGVAADRIPQKRILLCVATLEFSAMALVAVLSIADLTQIWHLAAVSFATGMGMAFYYPAYSAWLPSLVDESDLMAVNGFEGMIRPTLGQAIGPGVAGVVVGAVSSGAAVGVAACFALAGLVALSFVPLTPVRRDPDATPGGGAPRHLRPARRARGLRLHGAHSLAAGHAVVRRSDDPGDHGSVRGADPVPDQGPAGWRPRRPRHGDGRLRHRRSPGVPGDGLPADASALPDRDEPDVGSRLPAR